MDSELVNIGSLIDKEILNLSDGTFVGKAQNIMINPIDKVATGILLKQKGLLGSKSMLPLHNVKAFGSHTITVSSLQDMTTSTGVSILNMPVITIDGTILGRVLDFAFDFETGALQEVVLSGGILEGSSMTYGTLTAEHLSAIGRDVIIANEKVGINHLLPCNETVYSTWQDCDDIIDSLEAADDDDDVGEELEDFFYDNDLFDEGALPEKLKQQATKLTEEAKELFENAKAKFQGSKLLQVDAEQIKNDLKQKMTLKDKQETSGQFLTEEIVNQLKDATVSKPLLDAVGNVILWPGQIIGVEEVNLAIETGKLQDLISLTIPLASTTIDDKEDELI